MAVVDRSGKVVGSETTGTNKDTKVELKPITLEELKKKGLVGATVQHNLEEDAWARTAPPPKGRYKLRIFLGRDGFKYGYANPSTPKDDEVYVSAPLECKIVSDNTDLDGITIFAGVSTRMFRGRNISTMVGMIVKGLGQKAVPKNSLNVLEQVQLFSAFLKKEPIIEAHLDWRASYQRVDGTYENALKRYEDFPEDNDSTENPKPRLHICTVTRQDGGFEEVNAQVFVSHWYSKGEAGIVEKVGHVGVGGVKGNSNSNQVVKPIQVVVPQVVNNPVQQNLPLTNVEPNQQQVEEDMALLLE